MVSVLKKNDEVEYCRFYNLLESPFKKEFDCDKFYRGGGRQTVFEDLCIAIENDTQCTLVKAEAGSGKTSMCRMVSNHIDNSLCLYINGNYKNIKQQLAKGLMLTPEKDELGVDVNQRLLAALKLHQRVVILIEGSAGITAQTYEWLIAVQKIALEVNQVISLVFMCSESEYNTLKQGFSLDTSCVLEMTALTEYETYEYLNDHMRLCGAIDTMHFDRNVAAAIYRSTEGVFAQIVQLSDEITREAFIRKSRFPRYFHQSKLIRSNSQRIPFKSFPALLTLRNSLLAGVFSGAIVLVAIWSMAGLDTVYKQELQVDEVVASR